MKSAGELDEATLLPTSLQRTLPGSYYLSAEMHERERRAIFYREWYCVGRVEDLPSAGDYAVYEVGSESILVVRTRAGELRAHYNVCRHRGARLVANAEANDGVRCAAGSFTGGIRCPYHAWTYGLEGDLRGAPFLKEDDGLHKGDLSLHPVDLETWGGFIFLKLTPGDGPSLVSQLGQVPNRLRHYPLADLRRAHTIVYEVAANWKVILENYNECYHCGPVHPELCDLVPAFRAGGGGLDWDKGIPHRDGAYTFTSSGTTKRELFPDLDDEERIRHKGELVYPNLMISLSADHVAAFTLHARGPGQTIIVCDFLFQSHEIAKDGFDASDATEFWDLVNRQDWRICESVQMGMSSRVFDTGFYAPMEDQSLDIRRYITERLRLND